MVATAVHWIKEKFSTFGSTGMWARIGQVKGNVINAASPEYNPDYMKKKKALETRQLALDSLVKIFE